MKRITYLIAVLAAPFAVQEVGAQNIRVIEARVTSVEQRLTAIENQLSGTSAGVSSPGIAPKLSAPAPAPAPEQSYVIRDGDSVGGIARKFSVPRQALLNANNMVEGQPIYIGETLVIPNAPSHADVAPPAGNGLVHTVQPGDTLTGLSRRYGTTVAGIKMANQLHSDVIGTGQRLVIPTNNSPVPQETTVTTKTGDTFQYDNPLLNSNETYGYYMVQKGDNLYALARDFFTTMMELQRLNNLGNTSVIHPGHELIVPTLKYNDYHQNVAKN